MIEKLGNKEKLLEIKNKYHNKQLADGLTNEKEFMELSIQDDKLVPQKNFIYRFPLKTNGRAHFYAPVKRISNYFIDTFWFNIIVIWIYSCFLFVLLYFDILRKIIAYFETLRLNRIARRRLLRLLNITEQQPIKGK